MVLKNITIFLLSLYLKSGCSVNIAKLESLEMCDPNVNYSNTVFAKIKTSGMIQYIDFMLDHKVDLDQNVHAQLTINVSRGDSNYITLAKSTHKYICRDLNKYIPMLWHDIERAAGIPAGQCPMRKGRYRAQNYRFRMNLIPLGFVPQGKIRAMLRYYSSANKNIMCLLIIGTNKLSTL